MALSLRVDRSPQFLADCERLGLRSHQIASIVRAVMIRAEADPYLEVVVLASLPVTGGVLKRPRVALTRSGNDITLVGIADG